MCELRFSKHKVSAVFWLTVYITLSLIIMKVLSFIQISWWLVTMPIWILPFAIIVTGTALFIAIVIGAFAGVIYRNIAEAIKRQ